MLRHWCWQLLATFLLVKAFVAAYWRLGFRLKNDLNLPIAITLSETEKRRMRHYFLGATYLQVIFCSLLGRRLTRREHYLFSNLSALAAFFDDLVDGQREQVVRSGNYAIFGQMADKRGVAQGLLDNIQQQLPTENLLAFQAYLERVFAIEKLGQNNADNHLTFNLLEKITAEKGGSAVLLFRALLEPLPDPEEQQALQEFGYLLQLSDDIFDVWFDQAAGLATLATKLVESGRLGDLNQLFEQQRETTIQAFQKMEVSKWRLALAHRLVHTLTAITRTCLQHYQQAEIIYGQSYWNNRTLMVVDMEMWRNRLRAGRVMFFSETEFSSKIETF